jgi:hypothetical protein
VEPIVGMRYRVRLRSPMRREWDTEAEYECIEGAFRGYARFAAPLPHEGDQGRGVGVTVALEDVLEEVG